MAKQQVQTVLERAAQHCQTRGTKLTDKRRTVLTGLLESDTALSAYELRDYCKQRLGMDLLPMSIYRILEFLQTEALVHRLDLKNKYVACAHITCSHEHDHDVPQFLICKACDRVTEAILPRELLASIADTISDAGYQLVNSQLELDCLCKQCAAASELPH